MKDIGRVERDDYLRLVARKTGKAKWLVIGLCVACLGSGFGGGYLQGKRSRSITVEQALEMLQRVPTHDWQAHQALGALYSAVHSSISTLSDWAQDPGRPGLDAAVYLRHLVTECLGEIKKHADDSVSPHRERHLDALSALRGRLK